MSPPRAAFRVRPKPPACPRTSSGAPGTGVEQRKESDGGGGGKTRVGLKHHPPGVCWSRRVFVFSPRLPLQSPCAWSPLTALSRGEGSRFGREFSARRQNTLNGA